MCLIANADSCQEFGALPTNWASPLAKTHNARRHPLCLPLGDRLPRAVWRYSTTTLTGSRSAKACPEKRLSTKDM